MRGMGVDDQIKSAFQDIVAPEIHALRGDMHAVTERIAALDQKIDGVDARLSGKIDAVDGRLGARIDALSGRLDAFRGEMGSMKNELISEIRRLDTRIDGIDRELHAAIDIRERLAALEARRAP